MCPQQDIVRNPVESIKKVSSFLGYAMSKEQVDSVADAISFSRSKKEAQKNSGIAAIVNKGKIGRWKDILTQRQSERIDRIIAGRLKDSGIEFTFE